MFAMHPSLQAILDVAVAGWARTVPPTGPAFWTHTNGLHLVSQRPGARVVPPDGPQWEIVLTLGNKELTLQFPKMHRHRLGTDITPLLHDIRAWVQTLDMAPRTVVATYLSAYLAHQGKTGIYTGVLKYVQPQDNILMLYAGTLPNRPPACVLPSPLMEILQPHIDAIWGLGPTPSGSFSVESWPPFETSMHSDRYFQIILPQTAHARMALIASMPELLAVLG